MATFIYKAVNNQGKMAEGQIEASDARSATDHLQRQGLIPVSVSAHSRRESNVSAFIFQRITRKDLLFFTEELSSLVRAGLPLDRSLTIAAELATKPALRAVIENVLKQIKGGRSLAEALEAHPKQFSPLYVNMVRAGEAGGVLDVILERLTEFQRSADELRSHLLASLVYPALLLSVGVASMVILLQFVVPRFVTMFEDMGAAMPPTMLVLMGISGFTSRYFWALLVGLIGAIFGIRAWIRTDQGGRTWDALKLRLPLVGTTLTKIEMARFARTLGTLLSSAVPLIGAVRIVQEIVHNRVLSEGIAKITVGAKRGEGVARPMREAGVFPALAIHLVEVGEETGRLDAMLLQVADSYEKDVRTSVKALTSVFEPVIILVMGVLVGVVVLSMLTAIFSINEIGF